VQSLAKNNPVVMYFCIAFAFSWSVWLIGAQYVSSFEAMMPALMLGSFGPFMAGLIVSALRGGGTAVKAFLLQIIKWRAPLWCYFAAWLIFPAVFIIGLLLGRMLAFDASLVGIVSSVIVAMPLNALLTGLFSPGPLGEEPGWRGFALPNLLHLGERQTNIVLGLIWALWHVPLALRFPEFYQTLPGVTLPMWLVLYPLTIIAMTVALTKLWKWTGSVLIAIFFHASANYSMGVLTGGDRLKLVYSPFVAFLIVTALFWVVAGVFVAIDRTLAQRTAVSAKPLTNP
jgi:membrane protease YdiL (CAAX protease family)